MKMRLSGYKLRRLFHSGTCCQRDLFPARLPTVKDLWEQAILPYNLPLTILLGAVVLFWLITLLGVLSVDAFDLDLPEGDGDLHHAGELPGALLRFVNAGNVPVTVVLSVLVLAMWLVSVLVNYHFNPGGSMWLAGGFLILALVSGVVVTKIVTQPLVPLMRRLKQAEDAKPVVGELGRVRSIELTDRYGQVEVIREDGAPALLNARLAEGSPPLPRDAEVAVISFDPDAGVYLVAPVPNASSEILA
jgi:hypothetical protein